jgi:hypothetical protein
LLIGVWSALLVVLSTAGVARAVPSFDVAPKLNGVPLGKYVQVLEDPLSSQRIEDVVGPDRAMHFQDTESDAPSFGLTQSTYWIRVPIHNSGGATRAWLLELAYPQLDDVTLYVPGPDGNFSARATGDSRPFASRDLAYRTFIFSLHEPVASERTYYLRVKTTGAMNLPLVVWDAESFIAHQPYDLGAAFFL